MCDIGDGQTPTLRLGVPSLGSSFLLKLDSTGTDRLLGVLRRTVRGRASVEGRCRSARSGIRHHTRRDPSHGGGLRVPCRIRTHIHNQAEQHRGSALVYVAQIPAYAAGVATDAAGAVYVAGTTASREFPTTPGAFQERIANSDSPWSTAAFVVKLNAAGTTSGLLNVPGRKWMGTRQLGSREVRQQSPLMRMAAHT